MEVLVVTTKDCDMRSEIIGWTHEDAGLFVSGKPIGMTSSPVPPSSPKTILEALFYRWKLLGPPVEEPAEYTVNGNYFTWWLTREK